VHSILYIYDVAIRQALMWLV